MTKPKRKRTAKERAARKARKRDYELVFINGKQKRIKKPPMIDDMLVDEFIDRNADPIFLHQEGLWHLMPTDFGETAESVETDGDGTLQSVC